MGRLRIITEQLETDKLLEQEIQTNRTGIYDKTFQAIQTNAELDKKTDEENGEESTETEEPEGSSAGSDANQEDQVLAEATESIRCYQVSTEDFKGTVKAGAAQFWGMVKYLSELGIKYGPGILQSVGKGVLYVTGQVARLLLAGSETVQKYLSRRINSYNNLLGQVESLKKAIAVIEGYEKQTDVSSLFYSKPKVINMLKNGESVDLSLNMKGLETFVASMISNIGQRIQDDVAATKHLLVYAGEAQTAKAISLMSVAGLSEGMTERVVPGYVPGSDNVQSFAYKANIPGDVVFIAMLPKEELQDKAAIVDAYNHSSMVLGIDTNSFHEINQLSYMDLNGLKAFVDSLEKLCRLCISHQSLYEGIAKSKQDLRIGFKRYVEGLISSSIQVEREDSLVDFIHLKTTFVDKVYLVAAMDIHDYVAKVLTNAITFTHSNVKALSQ